MNHASRFTHHATRVSVIIPVYNGGSNFRCCLEAVRACDPPPAEVIVVDDGSTDESAQAAQAWGARVLSTTQPRGGPARARNLGAQQATGDVLLFVDADVALHPDAIGRVAQSFETDPNLTACFGSYDDAPAASNFLSQYKNLFHHYVHQSARAEASTFWAGCGAIRRDVFLSAGGFGERYTRPAIEDIELGYRLKAAGCTLRLDKDLQGKHLKRWTWRSLLRSDIFDRGVPWTELILRDGAFVNDLNLQTHNRVSVAAVYGLLLAMLLGLAWPAAWLAMSVLALLLLRLNAPVYRLFASKRGLFFALRAIPLHWLYYVYNGVSFSIGLGKYIRTRMHTEEHRLNLSRVLRVNPRPTLLIILLIAALFRFVNLGADSFWFDELLQVNLAAQDIPTLFSQLGQHAAMPLDYLVTHFVLSISRSEYLLRFPAAAWGVLTVPLLYHIGRRLFSRNAGIGAALLLALSGVHAFYSQEMRPYALVTLLAALSFYLLLRSWQDGRRRDWLGYSAVVTAGVFTHYFMLFVIAAQALIVGGLWLMDRARANGRAYARFALALAPTFLALALTPWFGSVLDAGRLFVVSIIAPGALPADSFVGELRGDATPIDLGFFQDRLLGSLSGAGPILPPVFVFFSAAGIGFGLRRARRSLAWVLIWAVVPAALVIAFLYHRGTFFAIRYILFVLPALLLLIAFGAVSLAQTILASPVKVSRQHIATTKDANADPRSYTNEHEQNRSRFTFHVFRLVPAIILAALVMLLGFAWQQAALYVSAGREHWREAGRFLSENVRAGDRVAAAQHSDIILFYAPALPAEVRSSALPSDLPDALPPDQRLWLVTNRYVYPADVYREWAGARVSVEYRVDEAVQVFLVAAANSKVELLRATRSIQPPNTSQAHAALAEQYEAASEADTSAEQYREAIALAASPEQTIGLTLKLGDVLRRARRFEAAVSEYEQVLSLNPISPDALIGLGRVYLEQDRLAEAQAQLMQALALDPRSYAANLFLADVYRRQGEHERAAAYYAVAADIVPELITPP
ncbi:MAG TPA: glycosyltransferase [Anaerolineae bacterium]|nr:glycosyltransferase [Anaerolineae bacterium]